jgi:hypothetical protein
VIRELVHECDFRLELPDARSFGNWKFSRETRRTGRLRECLNVPQSSAFCPD